MDFTLLLEFQILNLGPFTLLNGPYYFRRDTNSEWKVDRRKLMSKSLNTCYHDETLNGQVRVVINNSKIYKR